MEEPMYRFLSTLVVLTLVIITSVGSTVHAAPKNPPVSGKEWEQAASGVWRYSEVNGDNQRVLWYFEGLAGFAWMLENVNAPDLKETEAQFRANPDSIIYKHRYQSAKFAYDSTYRFLQQQKITSLEAVRPIYPNSVSGEPCSPYYNRNAWIDLGTRSAHATAAANSCSNTYGVSVEALAQAGDLSDERNAYVNGYASVRADRTLSSSGRCYARAYAAYGIATYPYTVGSQTTASDDDCR